MRDQATESWSSENGVGFCFSASWRTLSTGSLWLIARELSFLTANVYCCWELLLQISAICWLLRKSSLWRKVSRLSSRQREKAPVASGRGEMINRPEKFLKPGKLFLDSRRRKALIEKFAFHLSKYELCS